MTYIERRERILEALAEKETVTKRSLEESLNASEATIRRDLVLMEKEGVLERFWGGAKRLPNKDIYKRKILEGAVSEDMRIVGETAAGFIKKSELIFIGSGKTTLAMIEYIKAENLTVISNGIPQLEALAKRGINAFLLCGFFKEYSKAVVGRQTINMLSEYKFDRAFLGTRGFDQTLSPLSGDEYEYDIKNVCIENANHSYILADHTKFNRSAMFATPEKLSRRIIIISDRKADRLLGFQEEEPGLVLHKK